MTAWSRCRTPARNSPRSCSARATACVCSTRARHLAARPAICSNSPISNLIALESDAHARASHRRKSAAARLEAEVRDWRRGRAGQVARRYRSALRPHSCRRAVFRIGHRAASSGHSLVAARLGYSGAGRRAAAHSRGALAAREARRRVALRYVLDLPRRRRIAGAVVWKQVPGCGTIGRAGATVAHSGPRACRRSGRFPCRTRRTGSNPDHDGFFYARFQKR